MEAKIEIKVLQAKNEIQDRLHADRQNIMDKISEVTLLGMKNEQNHRDLYKNMENLISHANSGQKSNSELDLRALQDAYIDLEKNKLNEN